MKETCLRQSEKNFIRSCLLNNFFASKNWFGVNDATITLNRDCFIFYLFLAKFFFSRKHCIAFFKGSIYEWVQYHRLHHKHFGTDLDPYNPSKGLVYSQFISVTLKPSPAISKELESIDMSDIKDDKIVMFQKKYVPTHHHSLLPVTINITFFFRYYWLLYIVLCLLLPINAPAEYWGESLKNALLVAGILRIGICIQMANLIHSATRIWGLQHGEK